MNQTADIIEMSALPIATNAKGASIPIEAEQVTGTLHILPLPTTRSPDFIAWMKVRQRLGQIARLQRGWNGTEGAGPDHQTIVFAGKELANLQRLGIPAPAVNPSPDGSLYAEWHSKGIDIEVITHGPYEVVVLVEDTLRELPALEVDSSDFRPALYALTVLASR